jgi:hypothetical protein
MVLTAFIDILRKNEYPVFLYNYTPFSAKNVSHRNSY